MKPIIFSTPMVQAILDGRKTMTRRVIKPQTVTRNTPGGMMVESLDDFMHRNKKDFELMAACAAPYQPGDILWVRETWLREDCTPDCAGREDENECPFNRVGNACYGYKAQYLTGGDIFIKWRPSIHMPKEAARIFLRVTYVRVEQVQDITEADADAEGAAFYSPKFKTDVATIPWRMTTSRTKFCALWDSIYAKRGYGWDSNPWVWVIEFERTPSGAIGPDAGERTERKRRGRSNIVEVEG